MNRRMFVVFHYSGYSRVINWLGLFRSWSTVCGFISSHVCRAETNPPVTIVAVEIFSISEFTRVCWNSE